MSRSFLGPSPSWEEEDVVYEHAVSRAGDLLRRRLLARVAALESVPLDGLVLEIRCQVAESAVTGHLSAASDLNDLLMELLTAREHMTRP